MCRQCGHIDSEHLDGCCGKCECGQFQQPGVIEHVVMPGPQYVAIAPQPLKLTDGPRHPPLNGWR